jgi:hypothetical protein
LSYALTIFLLLSDSVPYFFSLSFPFLSFFSFPFLSFLQVQAFNCALTKLEAINDSSLAPAGRAYFISDGTPIDNFEFLQPLCEARGRTFPALILPTWFFLSLAQLFEWLHHSPLHLEPLLTRAEVLKVGVTHYFRIDRAVSELGYRPILSSQQGALQLAEHYGKPADVLTSRDYFEFVPLIWWVLVLTGMTLVFIAAYGETQDLTSYLSISDEVLCGGFTGCEALLKESSSLRGTVRALLFFLRMPVAATTSLQLWLFGSRRNVRSVWLSAVAAHVFEAALAVSQARFRRLRSWPLWGLQTLLLGYPSLSRLSARLTVVSNA